MKGREIEALRGACDGEWPLEDRGKRVARKIAGNWCPPPPRFFISVDGSVDILPDEGMPQAIEVVGKTEQQGLANLYG
jgi:hypothetical protein